MTKATPRRVQHQDAGPYRLTEKGTMHDSQRRTIEEALEVMNRAVRGSELSELFPGSSAEDEILLTVRGANPDEDAGVALRQRDGTLEIAGYYDPNSPDHPGGQWGVRLDDLQRVAAQPERFGSDSKGVAAVIT